MAEGPTLIPEGVDSTRLPASENTLSEPDRADGTRA